jgi:hypothetical protein
VYAHSDPRRLDGFAGVGMGVKVGDCAFCKVAMCHLDLGEALDGAQLDAV